MTVVAFGSVKGAPGVTTLACLVAAAWPPDRAVMVVECDASGGDLAARFRLASRIGWPSLVAAARRAQETVPIASHLQQIPGGLDVLVGASQLPSVQAITELAPSLLRADSPSGAPRDVLVDLGRLSQRDGARRHGWIWPILLSCVLAAMAHHWCRCAIGSSPTCRGGATVSVWRSLETRTTRGQRWSASPLFPCSSRSRLIPARQLPSPVGEEGRDDCRGQSF